MLYSPPQPPTHHTSQRGILLPHCELPTLAAYGWGSGAPRVRGQGFPLHHPRSTVVFRGDHAKTQVSSAVDRPVSRAQGQLTCQGKKQCPPLPVPEGRGADLHWARAGGWAEARAAWKEAGYPRAARQADRCAPSGPGKSSDFVGEPSEAGLTFASIGQGPQGVTASHSGASSAEHTEYRPARRKAPSFGNSPRAAGPPARWQHPPTVREPRGGPLACCVGEDAPSPSRIVPLRDRSLPLGETRGALSKLVFICHLHSLLPLPKRSIRHHLQG